MDDEEAEKLRDKVDKGAECYEPIPEIESYEGYEGMEDFIVHLEKILARLQALI